MWRTRLVNLFFLFLLNTPLLGQSETTVDEIILENELVKASFDKTTGSLLSLIFKKTGWDVQRNSDATQSFLMYVPTENERHLTISGTRQLLKSYTLKDGTLNLFWENLKDAYAEERTISFQGIVKLTEHGIAFSALCENNSKLTIEAIAWPYLGDFTVPHKTKKTSWLTFDYNGGTTFSEISPNFSSNHGYWGVDHPVQTHTTQYAHFGLLQTEGHGSYVAYDDITDTHRVDFTLTLLPGYAQNEHQWMNYGTVPTQDSINGQPVRYEFSAMHFPYIRPKETDALAPIVFNPYQGDWHQGADFYMAWRKTWKKNRVLPKWASDVHSWYQIHMNSAEDRTVLRYEELPDYCDACAENDIRAIQLTGWTQGGQDRGNPSHDIDPRLGTWQQLKDAIESCHNKGVKIVLFNKYTWADQSKDWFKDELVNYAVKDPYGNYPVYMGYRYQTPMQLADINTRRLVPLCPFSTPWRKIAIAEFEKSIDLGAAGMLFDENQHHGGSFYCFDEGHNHHVPANIFSGDRLLEADFWKSIDRKNPDYLLVGESNRDMQFQNYHMSYFRIGPDYHPLHRYVAPMEKMQIAIVGQNDRHMLNQALLYNFIISYEPLNFKGKLDFFQQTLAYGKQIDALRKTYSDYLWHGIFRDTLDAIVSENEAPYIQYSVYRNLTNGKRAVVIENPEKTSAKTVTVTIPNVKNGLVVVRPGNLTEEPLGKTVEIKPLSVVVIIEK